MSSYSYSGQCKERDGKHREAGCHDFPHPGLRNRVTVPSIFISVSNDLSELGPCYPIVVTVITPHQRASA